ncbi:transglutaminase-like domain-containing protein [Microlunatus endophyticus]|uniref:transglutaminase-like domain-containing protein n=1 Tax=Microlunatus endophyticus TaxID=1716077 RepID=UPI001E366FB0|nr:transglutaminase-like domain-containing protein [Microlunatus endophyticus]
MARNVIGHFGTDFVNLTEARRDEVNLRSVARILDVDQARHPYGLDLPRDRQGRVAGCCRDHSVFVVGLLREQGTPARTRVGFADYLIPDRRVDHVVVDYRAAGRWIRTDPEMAPGTVPFDPADMKIESDGRFQTAAEAWQSCRHDPDNLDRYLVPPGSGFADAAHVIRAYVALELAHWCGQELLLWDTWPDLDAFDADLVDRVARLLVAADTGDKASEVELTAIYHRFGPHGTVTQLSPFGKPPRQVRIETEPNDRQQP